MDFNQTYQRVKRAVLAGRKKSVQQAYKDTFSTPQGQMVLRHLMKVSGVTGTIFVANDPHQTSLNEGKRMLVMSILKFIHKKEDHINDEVEQAIQDENPI